MSDITVPAADLPPGRVVGAGRWAVGNRNGETFAVSRRCRHQLGDLGQGSLDPNGCLVCPWHQARYDVQSGLMVAGPRGFLGYHGKTPGYTALVRAFGRVARLRVGRTSRKGDNVIVR